MLTAKLKRSYCHSNSGVPPLQHSLPELLDIRGDANPDKEAYVIRNIGVPRQAITFGELKTRTQQLAAAMIALGLQKGERVALICPTSIDYVVCEYATARTGAILVKMSAALKTADDIKYILNKSGAKWIIAHPGGDGANYTLLKTTIPGLADHNPKDNLEVKDLPSVERIFMLGGEQFPGTVLLKSIIENQQYDMNELVLRQALITNDDIQELFVTSGSTGFPKLVARPYDLEINGWRSSSLRNGISSDDKYITDRPMAYAAGMIGPALGIGYTMVYVVTTATVGAGPKGAEFMLRCSEEEGCTVMLMFPYLLTDFLRLSEEGKFNIGKVHTGIISGQALNSALFAKCLQIIPGLLNSYGSTEGNVPICNLRGDSVERKINFTGTASDGEVKIVDETGNIVPVDTTGELCLRNNFMFVEYWGENELTKKVKKPRGWFHTDDMAVMDEDGYILVLGRKQEVITRATIKIYPMTIENVIIRHPDVSNVVVVGVPDERLHEEICACVLLQDKMAERGVQDYCRDALAGVDEDGLSLCPKYFVFLERLPCGPTGKIDRKKVKQTALEYLGMN